MRRLNPLGSSMDERRRFRRIQAPVFCRPAGLRIFSKHEETVDLSRGGVRVYSDLDMSVGERLTLELFSAGAQQVSFQAEVVWIERLPDGGAAKYDVGLKFLTLDLAAHALLTRVLGE
jgi:c-di-GMP-binding flagellar brake protein YcgR